MKFKKLLTPKSVFPMPLVAVMRVLTLHNSQKKIEFCFFSQRVASPMLCSPPCPVCPRDAGQGPPNLLALKSIWGQVWGYWRKGIDQNQQNSQSLENFSGLRSLVFC